MNSSATTIETRTQRLTPGSVLLMAIACGLTVANIYYNQPMLEDIARDYRITALQIGFIPMLTQLGYATGLLMLTPLGDRLDRRKLIMAMLVVLIVALVGAALAPSLPALGAASYVIGIASTVAQQVVPLAAQLAEPSRRGKTVGQVMSGLLIGILLARTLSGWIATVLGWRDMFGIAAAMMAVMAIVLARGLPHAEPNTRLPYPQLMMSLVHLSRRHAALREAALVGGLLFGAFSVFWSTLTLWLASPAYGLDANAAGMFGLVGVVGALAAPLAGRLADHGGPRRVLAVGIAVIIAAFLVFGGLGHHLWGLVIGVILLDLGAQSCQIANQTRIYALDHEAASRLNTVYMSVYFVIGALGSSLGSIAWTHYGWTGVSTVGLLLTAAAGWRHWLGRHANYSSQ